MLLRYRSGEVDMDEGVDGVDSFLRNLPQILISVIVIMIAYSVFQFFNSPVGSALGDALGELVGLISMAVNKTAFAFPVILVLGIVYMVARVFEQAFGVKPGLAVRNTFDFFNERYRKTRTNHVNGMHDAVMKHITEGESTAERVSDLTTGKQEWTEIDPLRKHAVNMVLHQIETNFDITKDNITLLILDGERGGTNELSKFLYENKSALATDNDLDEVRSMVKDVQNTKPSDGQNKITLIRDTLHKSSKFKKK